LQENCSQHLPIHVRYSYTPEKMIMNKQTGVIIARFQTPYLHEGHKAILEFVKSQHNKVVVVLGVTPVKGSRYNPYDFYTREKMIKGEYPDLVILPLSDHPSDKAWSRNLDELLQSTFSNEGFKFYGSRDSFIPYYAGRFETENFPETGEYNATEIRHEISDKVYSSEQFRAGINYAYHNQYAKVYPTVDVAVFRKNRTEILLGQKSTLNQWRVPGGFTDPTDESFEAAGKRELQEECGQIEVSELQYEKSFRVDDWRYRKEEDKIITTLFSTDLLFGQPNAADDLVNLQWFPVDSLPQMIERKELVPEHQPLFEHLIQRYLQTENNITL